MNPFSTLFDSIYRYFNPHWDFVMTESLAAFRTYLNGATNGMIRMWVDGSEGTGHQASTVAILRQLADQGDAGFGYAGSIEVYYERGKLGAPTLAKLQALLPEVGDGTHGTVGLAAVDLIEWKDGTIPTPVVNLGFTGGADDYDVAGKPVSPNFAARLNTRFLLRLQPYLWGAPNQVQFSDAERPFVTLTQQRALGYDSFNQRAYFLATPIKEPDWSLYSAGNYAEKAAIVKELTVPQGERFGQFPVYSIRSSNGMQLPLPAFERMFEVVTSVLASQRTPTGGAAPGAKSIVVLSCDVFGDTLDREALPTLMAGGPTWTEQSERTKLEAGEDQLGNKIKPKEKAEISNFLKGQEARRAWLSGITATDRVHYAWDATVESVKAELGWLGDRADRVLFVQLGRVPAPLFQWLMQQAEWPSVFEGQNTASVALNIAKPYFHLTRPGTAVVQYPTTVIGYDDYERVETDELWLPAVFYPQVPRQIQDVANWLVWPASIWSPKPAENPAEQVGAWVRSFRQETDKGPVHKYFMSVREFYRIVNNDKLHLGTAFLQYILRGQDLLDAAVAAPSPLQTILDALNANRSADGVLKVAPGALTKGGIYSFYTKFLGTDPGLTLEGSEIKPVNVGGVLTAIEVTGTTTFFGLRLEAEMTFTAPTGVAVAAARYTYKERWTLDEIPWIGFGKPFVAFYTPDEAAPPAGAVGGTLEGVGIELAFQLPVTEGKWQLSGTFTPPYPSIASFYQFAGGVDLVRALPAPFNGLAGFGLQNTSLVYDLPSKTIEYIGFRFATSAGFALIGTLNVTNVRADVLVQNPTDVRARPVQWTVQGTFTLGTRADAGVILIAARGPNLNLTGRLVSGVLRISDIINAFAPGVDLNPPSEPVVTQFQMSLTPATGDYSVSCNLNLNWPVVVAGIQVFSIEGIQFASTRLSGTVTASLIGSVTVGSGALAVPLQLSALYSTTDSWTFLMAQASGSVFSLSALASQFLPSGWEVQPDYAVTGLSLSLRTKSNSWAFSAKTATPWEVPFISDLRVSASVTLGYNGGTAASLASLPGMRDSTVPLNFAETGGCQGSGYFTRIDTEWLWHNIPLKVYLDYCGKKQKYGIVWEELEGTVEGPDKSGDWVATLRFTKNVTLGRLIEKMVSWATGSAFALETPWDFLNKVPVSGLALTYTFNSADSTRNKVGFKIDIGPIDLGFARINSIGVVYDPEAERKVAVTLDGSFPWNIGDPANGNTSTLGPWDASKPGATPAPPGSGNRYLDLRLLALGQHVTVQGLTQAKTVQKAIELMCSMKDPAPPPKIPEVTFDAGSSWLVGADFGVLRFGDDKKPAGPKAPEGTEPLAPVAPGPAVPAVSPQTSIDAAPATTGYVVTMQVVFNDPYLYGLRLALAGDAAKVFKGLDFQIMYRQVSNTVGVYQAEIALPDVMRHLSIGAYSITLPVFGIAIYTNGDFQVDVGFPWNEDFSRSFTIEALIYPGIPVLGSAGFYFGKLSSASSEKVPKALNGTFNPVLVFGVGMQIGFGKSVEYGVLKAGFSITAVGIFEGVLGKFNPYLPSTTSGNESQLQGSYYFWLRGTFGIMGRLYGSVDFAVVKADVNVTLRLLVQLTYESFVSISISVMVSVDVSVSIKIDLGIFSIKISFKFSMRLVETFTIDNRGAAPWITSTKPAGALATADGRVRDFRSPTPEFVAAFGAPDRWKRLLSSPAGPQPLTGYIAPGLSVAHDEYDTAQDVQRQVACYVLMPLIDTVDADEKPLAEVLADTLAAAGTDTSFELLAKMVLRWAVAAGQQHDVTPDTVDGMIVTEADLAFVLDELLSSDATPVPIAPEDVDTFLERQFHVTLSLPPQDAPGQASCTSFPMPPAVRLVTSPYGPDYPGSDYVFGGYNELDGAALTELRRYFDDLAVQVSREMAAGSAPAATAAVGSQSMATWAQSDYFLLTARQMVQAALDALRDFKWVIAGQSAKAVVDEINRTGQLPEGQDRYTVERLFAANPSHLLKSDRRLTIGITQTVAADDSFESISIDHGSAVSPTDLAASNAANDRLLRAGTTIRYLDREYPVGAGDSLITVARHFDVRFAEFLSGAKDLMTQSMLFAADAPLLIPLATSQADSGSTFASIAGLPVYASAFTGTALAIQNAGRAILRIGEEVTYRSEPPYQVQADDTLADIAAHFRVTLAQLLADSDVLEQPQLLVDVAVVVTPSFPYATPTGQTLRDIATRFAIPLEVLGLDPTNGLVSDLFAVVQADGSPDPFLDVPHLVQYRVAQIIDETQRTLAIRNLSRMVARYTLHGLRLPTEGIVAKQKGIWVRGSAPNLTLPPKAGFFALTGQEIELPSIDAAKGDFTITLDRTNGPSWLSFGSGTNQLTVTVAPGSEDADRIQKVRSEARAKPLDIALESLGADAMYESHPSTYSLTTSLVWQTPAAIPLPYGPPPKPNAVPAMRIWKLPDALINLSRPGISERNPPRFVPRLATYDEASGGTISAALGSYGWSTIVDFTIKRIPPVATSPATLTTYEIAGAGGGEVMLLERIVDQLGAADAQFSQIGLGFQPAATSAATEGVQTDNPAAVTMGIAQVNLSTETRPPTGFASAAQAAESLGLLNSPSEFIRLLWEASITRSGGFYLYYYDTGSARGLPDRIFNDHNEAVVSLIVTYRGAIGAESDRVHDYMNAVVTGDSIDTSQSVVYVEAAPMEAPVTAGPDVSLTILAERTYSNIADLAFDNRSLALGAGVRLRVSQGVYQAPLAGIALADIVAAFGLSSVQQLNAANPQWRGGLPDPLPFPAAIYLPWVTLTVGTSVHTSSLDDIATYYGESLTALAAENSDVGGLFATGQSIVVPGGPSLRSATVPAGVEAVTASRAQPDDIPPKPADPGFARLFLLNGFSLLNYQVSANQFFRASKMGLPAGPTVPASEGVTSTDKVRVAPADVKTWEYQQAFPYPKFAITVSSEPTTLPPATDDPYRGLGSILQVDFSWQDYYGNTLVTSLSSPSPGAKGKTNEPPMLTGYVDPLIGLSQWPSVSSGWRVVPGTGGAPARLRIVLTFDPSRYCGLLTAAGSGSSVTATFTDQLDVASASNADNYRLTRGVVVRAVLGTDGRTVTLTTKDPLADGIYELSASNVLARQQGPNGAQESYSGTAGFLVPDDPNLRSSSLRASAEKDLRVYTALYYQLYDGNGIAVTVRTSLLTAEVDVVTDEWRKVLAWTFTGQGTASPIYAFIQNRADGKTDVSPPPSSSTISIDLPWGSLNPAQIYELSVELTIRRTGGAVLGDLETTPGIRSAVTAIPAVVAGDSDQGQGSLGLAAFARDFEAALSVPGSHLLKVAGGVDRAEVSSVRNGARLWSVRVGTADTVQPISYTINNVGDPDIFAPRPISNSLQSRTGVPIYDYKTGTGISPTVSRTLDFADIDMDVWGQSLFRAVDETLTPAFTAAAQIVTARMRAATPETSIKYLQAILDEKKRLAEAASLWMIPVFADETADPTQARVVFYEQLLSRLSNAYTARAALQFSATVTADVQEPIATVQPRLFGNIKDQKTSEGVRSEITLTSPKLSLRSTPSAPLPFLLLAPDKVVENGVVVSAIDLDVTYDATHIEHQISKLRGIDGYLASSWLSFIVPGETRPLTRKLGGFDVPMVLRSFPASPTMVVQTGVMTKPDAAALAELTRWTYGFTYSLPFHYLQDRVYCQIQFNVAQSQMPMADFEDAFPELAQFVTVYPDVRADLEAVVAGIDATTTDPTIIGNAAVALGAFVDLLHRITAKVGPGNPLVAAAPSAVPVAAEVYSFFVKEGEVELEDPSDQEKTVKALLVTIVGAPPSRTGAPVVLVDPERYCPVPYEGDQQTGEFSYYYADDTGRYLPLAEGQTVPDRTVELPDLDILQRQDAWSTVYLNRNEELIPGKPSAEPFVYTTPLVQFSNPLHPSIDSSDPVDIASIKSGTPVARPLDAQLDSLFQALFANLPSEPSSEVTIQVETTYAYRVNPLLDPIELPIFMQSPLPVRVGAPGPSAATPLTLGKMIQNWSAAIVTWFDDASPSPADGTVQFDLVIMSNLTQHPMPLLRLRNLRLDIVYVQPPLNTSAALPVD